MKPTLPWEDFPREPSAGVTISGVKKTPLIYYGGKTRSAEWVCRYISEISHKTFVDVFGGGGGIFFAKGPSDVDVYNDVGNVSNFFKVLREKGDMLYRSLYFTLYGREDFKFCSENWERFMREENDLEWARCWYVQIMQSFKHQEDDGSFLVSKDVNSASTFSHHVDDLFYVVKRLRNTIIENHDFRHIMVDYDKDDTLFYCDPPYVSESRSDGGKGYRNEMSESDHNELLDLACSCKAKVIISGYASDLYDDRLVHPYWERVEKTARQGIHNSKQNVGTRTEVLWVKQHAAGLWTGKKEENKSSTLAGVQKEEDIFKEMSFLQWR